MHIHFYIDTENTGHTWENIIPAMLPNDVVHLFVSEHSPKYDQLPVLDAPVVVHTCTSGSKNAMDFQLVAYLGFNTSANPGVAHVIVSGDKGFCAVRNSLRQAPVYTLCPKYNKHLRKLIEYLHRLEAGSWVATST